jgi:hypothetical protein
VQRTASLNNTLDKETHRSFLEKKKQYNNDESARLKSASIVNFCRKVRDEHRFQKLESFGVLHILSIFKKKSLPFAYRILSKLICSAKVDTDVSAPCSSDNRNKSN